MARGRKTTKGAVKVIPNASIRIGDELVIARVGARMQTSTVKSVAIARGCGNLHVNLSMCHDRAGYCEILMPEQEPLPGALEELTPAEVDGLTRVVTLVRMLNQKDEWEHSQ